jgi:hypothetical protein
MSDRYLASRNGVKQMGKHGPCSFHPRFGRGGGIGKRKVVPSEAKSPRFLTEILHTEHGHVVLGDEADESMDAHVNQGLEVNIELPVPTACGSNGLILSRTQGDAQFAVVSLKRKPRHIERVGLAVAHSSTSVFVPFTKSPHRAPHIKANVVIFVIDDAVLEVVILHRQQVLANGLLDNLTRQHGAVRIVSCSHEHHLSVGKDRLDVVGVTGSYKEVVRLMTVGHDGQVTARNEEPHSATSSFVVNLPIPRIGVFGVIKSPPPAIVAFQHVDGFATCPARTPIMFGQATTSGEITCGG